VNVSDPLTAACDRTDLAVGAGQSVTYSCAGLFAAGAGSNTATVTVVGTGVTSSATATFTVNSCPADNACADVGTPLFTIAADPATAVVTTQLTYAAGFDGALTMAPAPASGFSSGTVVSGANNTSNYEPPTQSPLDVTGSWTVSKNGNVCVSGSDSVTLTTVLGEPVCTDFTAPPATCDPSVTTTATQVTVDSISCSPAGGTFTPVPPQSGNRPAYGQSATSIHFDYIYDYSPVAGLSCQASTGIDVPVPPQLAPPAAAGSCSPGYWKNHPDSWAAAGYSPDDNYNSVFGVNDDPSLTLMGAIERNGGGSNAFARHAVAALLGASHPGVTNYPYSPAEVIAMVQDAYANGTFDAIGAQFAAVEDPCPLN